MNKLELIFKALSNRRRLKIIHFLKSRPSSVAEVAAELNISFNATSKHLVILERAGILDKKQHKLFVFYFLAPNQPEFLEKILFIL
ncbi:MAG: ArsR/SmtB family transcription factor [Acidobacteriaceae bacterium]